MSLIGLHEDTRISSQTVSTSEVACFSGDDNYGHSMLKDFHVILMFFPMVVADPVMTCIAVCLSLLVWNPE